MLFNLKGIVYPKITLSFILETQIKIFLIHWFNRNLMKLREYFLCAQRRQKLFCEFLDYLTIYCLPCQTSELPSLLIHHQYIVVRIIFIIVLVAKQLMVVVSEKLV